MELQKDIFTPLPREWQDKIQLAIAASYQLADTCPEWARDAAPGDTIEIGVAASLYGPVGRVTFQMGYGSDIAVVAVEVDETE